MEPVYVWAKKGENSKFMTRSCALKKSSAGHVIARLKKKEKLRIKS